MALQYQAPTAGLSQGLTSGIQSGLAMRQQAVSEEQNIRNAEIQAQENQRAQERLKMEQEQNERARREALALQQYHTELSTASTLGEKLDVQARWSVSGKIKDLNLDRIAPYLSAYGKAVGDDRFKKEVPFAASLIEGFQKSEKEKQEQEMSKEQRELSNQMKLEGYRSELKIKELEKKYGTIGGGAGKAFAPSKEQKLYDFLVSKGKQEDADLWLDTVVNEKVNPGVNTDKAIDLTLKLAKEVGKYDSSQEVELLQDAEDMLKNAKKAKGKALPKGTAGTSEIGTTGTAKRPLSAFGQ